jgi:hypothetical protein
MARFYQGQPIVCVWTEEEWLNRLSQSGRLYLMSLGIHIPVKGQRYTADRYATEQPMNLSLVEIPDEPRPFYIEDGFEPATDISELQKLQTSRPVPVPEDA